jgi:hypothetical protein
MPIQCRSPSASDSNAGDGDIRRATMIGGGGGWMSKATARHA